MNANISHMNMSFSGDFILESLIDMIVSQENFNNCIFSFISLNNSNLFTTKYSNLSITNTQFINIKLINKAMISLYSMQKTLIFYSQFEVNFWHLSYILFISIIRTMNCIYIHLINMKIYQLSKSLILLILLLKTQALSTILVFMEELLISNITICLGLW